MFHGLQVQEMDVFLVESQILRVWPAGMSATDGSGPVSESVLASGWSRKEYFARAGATIISHAEGLHISEEI